MKESEIERRVCFYAKKKGFLNLKFTSPGTRGVPDRIFFYQGSSFFIEFKQEKGKLSKAQETMLKKLKDHGISVFVVYSVEDGIAAIDSIKKDE